MVKGSRQAAFRGARRRRVEKRRQKDNDAMYVHDMRQPSTPPGFADKFTPQATGEHNTRRLSLPLSLSTENH